MKNLFKGVIPLTNKEKEKIIIDKTKEPRKQGISRMIDEGGLGADKYYEIKKEKQKDTTVFKDDEK